ncbi:hypothetical protein [Amycolatopsis sp. cmx-4-61]|uniref:hypothetical protein n=1 Tax=Amycolatopsis sp. cmx-4-61 TaxID=2790937 RepID=UPI00397DAD88
MIEFEDVRQWVEFDRTVRREPGYRRGRRLRRRPSREELAEAACNRDGYLREAAVERLAVSTDPEALPLLLIRCVDWVGPVRELARSIVPSKLDEPALRATLPLIGILRRRLLDDWMTTLLRERLPSVLDAVLALEDREARRWAHREALGLLPRERLLEIASTHHDFVVRSICGNALLDRGECVEELLAAGVPKVRMRALTLLGVDAAVTHLADRSSAVRSRRIAPEPAAVRPLLTDPSPAVTREVVKFLRGRFVDPATLLALLSPDHPVHTRRAAAALLRDRDTPPWRPKSKPISTAFRPTWPARSASSSRNSRDQRASHVIGGPSRVTGGASRVIGEASRVMPLSHA